MRHLFLIALLSFSAVLARAEQWEHNYPVTGKPQVFVDTNDGDVEVETSFSQQVGVRVIAHGWKINDDLKITGSQSGNRIEIKLHRADKVCFGFCFQSIRVELSVPRESDLDLHSGDGNIRIGNVRGNLQLETNDGDVRLKDVEGLLHANTHDGNIEVQGRFETLNLRTGDGNIEARVSASETAQPGWILRSGDGNIRLALPDNFAADLSVHTGDGSVKVDFPVATSGATEEKNVRGRINGGGISIEVETGDGDVHIEKS